jgi:hypothetical protein
MPDLGSLLLRRSLGSTDATGTRCATCRRTPLPGERLHELHSGGPLCDLCFAALPEPDRTAVRSERVRVSERQLAVVSKVA